MPSILDPNGNTQWVPGVYTATKVRSNLPGAVPEFHIPMLIGSAPEGHPYNAASLDEVHENFKPWYQVGTYGAGREYFGEGDLVTALKWAKRHGLPKGYLINAAPLTRASIIISSGTGAVDEIKLSALKFGAPGSFPKIKFATSILTITPVKTFSMCTANITSGDTRIYVADNSKFASGMKVSIADNATTVEVATISDVGSEVNSSGQLDQWVDIVAGATGGFATSSYAMILQYSTEEEISGTLSTAGAVHDWVRANSKVFTSTKLGTFSDAAGDPQAAALPLLELSTNWTPTVGTSPAAALVNHDAIITLLDASAWDLFLTDEGARPQAFLIADGTSTIHTSWRDWATARRNSGDPVSITSGTTWGDTVLTAGDSTDPGDRAQDLDNDSFMLCAPGYDYVDAYMSLAAAVFGRRVEGGVGHNLTSDKLVYSVGPERQWDETNTGELTTLHQKGVCTTRLSGSRPFRYVISQGLSTEQLNGAAWNEGPNTTPLVMQRDLADFVDGFVKDGLDGRQLGADQVTRDSVADVIRARGEFLKDKRQIITDFTVTSVVLNNSGNGYDADWSAVLPVTGDFLTNTTTILVGDQS